MSSILKFLGIGGEISSEDEPKKSSSIVFKGLFKNYPPPDPVQPTQFSGPYLDRVVKCCVLSEAVYCKQQDRKLPPEYGQMLFEEKISAKYFVPYLILNSDAENRIYIACRGSYCAADFAVDAQAIAVAWKGGYVHRGIFQTAVHLYSSLRLYVQDISMRFGRRPVTVTGHSLGGGIAGLVAEMFREEFPWMDVNAIVFAPSATISRDLWERSKSYIQAVVLEGDFVPFLTFQNLQGLFDSWPKPMKGLIIKAFTKAMLKTHSRPEGHPIEAKVPPHLAAILNQPPVDKSHTIPMFPPGDHYLLACVEVPGENGVMKRMVQVRKILSCDYFSHFVNNLNEFAHSCEGYVQWLTAYQKGAALGPVPWMAPNGPPPPAQTPPPHQVYPGQYRYPQSPSYPQIAQPPVYPQQRPMYPQQPHQQRPMYPQQPPQQRPMYPQQPPQQRPMYPQQPPSYPQVPQQPPMYPQPPSYPQQPPLYPQVPAGGQRPQPRF